MLTVTLKISKSAKFIKTIFCVMSDLQLVDSFPIWKAVLWCFYPMVVFIFIGLIASVLPDDDDDFGGGMMIPALLPIRAR